MRRAAFAGSSRKADLNMISGLARSGQLHVSLFEGRFSDAPRPRVLDSRHGSPDRRQDG